MPSDGEIRALLRDFGAATLGVADTLAIAALGSIVVGAGITLMDVVGRTMLQRSTDDEVLTRVFGAVEAMWLLGYAAGAAIAPPLASITSLTMSFAICGLAVFAAAVASLPVLRRVDAEAVVQRIATVER